MEVKRGMEVIRSGETRAKAPLASPRAPAATARSTSEHRAQAQSHAARPPTVLVVIRCRGRRRPGRRSRRAVVPSPTHSPARTLESGDVADVPFDALERRTAVRSLRRTRSRRADAARTVVHSRPRCPPRAARARLPRCTWPRSSRSMASIRREGGRPSWPSATSRRSSIKSGRGRRLASSASVGFGDFPTSTSSSCITRTCAGRTAEGRGATRRISMQPCGATSLAHRGFLLGAYAASDSSSSGPRQTSECEPGEASRRLGSSDRPANSCCISSDDKP